MPNLKQYCVEKATMIERDSCRKMSLKNFLLTLNIHGLNCMQIQLKIHKDNE